MPAGTDTPLRCDLLSDPRTTRSSGSDFPSSRVLNLLSCPDRIDGIHGADEHFPVAVLAGLCADLNRGDGCIQLCLVDNNGEHDLWQFAVNRIAHLPPTLLAAAKHIHLR